MNKVCLKVYFPEGDTLSEEEISNGPDICIYYDNADRKVKELLYESVITYDNDDNGLLLQTRKLSYDEETVSVNEYTADGELFHTREVVMHSGVPYKDGDSKETWITWQYGGLFCRKYIIIRHQNNEKRETIEEWYNDNGQLLEMYHMVEGEYGCWQELAEKNEYDGFDRMISSKRWEGGRLACEKTYKYHENGSISEIHSAERVDLKHGDNYISRRVEYYDESELLQRIEDLSTGVTTDFEYSFNDDGDWTQSRMIDNNGIIFRVFRVFEKWD